MKVTWKNLVTTSPSDVEDRDAFAVKVVAVAGFADDWAAYRGPSDWSDQRVAEQGDKLPCRAAEALFQVMAASGRQYRE